MQTSDFQYELPEEAIAQTAIEPRDAARLLITSTLEDSVFRRLPEYLEAGDLVVVNRTRVRPARLSGVKPATGGAVELLLTRRIDDQRWQAMIRPARRVVEGLRLDFGAVVGEVLTAPTDGVVTVRLESAHDAEGADVEDILALAGDVPLPPYFKGRLDDPDRYQTMFAKTVGSAAAPTAGLHFTPQVVAELGERGVDVTEVDLEVGLDTFRPIIADELEGHRIHRERYVVPEEAADAVAACRARGGRVIAVGTTVVRTLESAALPGGLVAAGRDDTELFVTPGYRLRVVDAVVTNFHAPGTTLIVMIAALLGPAWRSVYQAALDRGYRFLSFGDAMFIDHPVASR